jgi:sec-independent protein translocase protein TatA
MPLLASFNSPIDWLVIILVAVVLFGGKRLGDMGKGLGEGIKNFKDAFKSPSDNNGTDSAKKP